MNGVGLGMCRSVVLGIFLMSTIERLCVTFFSLIYFTLHKNKTLFMKPYILSSSNI